MKVGFILSFITFKNYKTMSKMKHSSGDDLHPYMKVQFWMNNPFWETDYYTPKAKEYFRKSVQEMVKNERKTYRLNQSTI